MTLCEIAPPEFAPDRNAGTGRGARRPSADKRGRAACRTLENTVLTQKAPCFLEGGGGANPMNFVDKVMSDIPR